MFSGFKKKIRNAISFKQNYGRRRGDSRILSEHERKILRKAKQLEESDQIHNASQLYISIQMERKAISVLEKNGYIDDAAHILIKMKLPHRAAALYARHDKWLKAAALYENADQPFNKGMMLKKAGEYQQAAKSFLKANDFIEAGHCHYQNEDFYKAAQNYQKAQLSAYAMQSLEKALEKNPQIIEENPDSLKLIFNQLRKGKTPKKIIAYLQKKDLLAEFILELIEKSETEIAAKIIDAASSQIWESLAKEFSRFTEETWHRLEEKLKRNQSQTIQLSKYLKSKQADIQISSQTTETEENIISANFAAQIPHEDDKSKVIATEHSLGVASQPQPFDGKALRSFEIFSQASLDLLNALSVYSKITSWQPGESIDSDANKETLYLLVNGEVRQQLASEELVHIAKPNSINHLDILAKSEVTIELKTVEHSEIIEIGSVDLFKLLHRYPADAIAIYQYALRALCPQKAYK